MWATCRKWSRTHWRAPQQLKWAHGGGGPARPPSGSVVAAVAPCTSASSVLADLAPRHGKVVPTIDVCAASHVTGCRADVACYRSDLARVGIACGYHASPAGGGGRWLASLQGHCARNVCVDQVGTSVGPGWKAHPGSPKRGWPTRVPESTSDVDAHWRSAPFGAIGPDWRLCAYRAHVDAWHTDHVRQPALTSHVFRAVLW